MADSIIETNGLTKIYSRWLGYSKIHAVEKLDLAVRAGCTFGFLGPNGAGKTTTIKMLLGLIRPTSGNGKILGYPLGDQAAKAQIGFLPEEPAFGRHLKAKEFLNLCARLSHVPKDIRAQRVEEVLKTTGLADRANHRLGEFSKGMVQRIGIAQTMLHDPELLILDEPMTGLDPAGRREIKEIIQGLASKGKTVFFSSHILSDVEELCDYVGILNRGRLILTGQLGELLGGAGMEVTAENVPAALLEKVEPHVTGMQKSGNQWTFQVVNAAISDKIKNILADAGGSNIQANRVQQKLEGLFMKTIETDDNQARKESGNG
ncbi:MAG: ABC transporter ATP-binding protein [Phycisphaerae bacterium]|nr:ABC transporter ATP-binding protein [Phycisphaerae bacterium]